MQETTVRADMAQDPSNERSLSDRELAQLLQARADALAEGEETREQVLVELLQLIVRETPNVEQRIDTIGTRGRVSFGRDRAGEFGTALFLPDEVIDAEALEDQLDEARGDT